MNPSFSRDQVLEGVMIDITDCLALEPGEVTPDASFFGVLPGESIELIDLSYRIQKRFGVRLSFQSLMDAWELDPDGKPSAATIERLKEKYTGIDWERRLTGFNAADPRDILTVELIAELVFHSQSAKDAPATASSHAGAGLT